MTEGIKPGHQFTIFEEIEKNNKQGDLEKFQMAIKEIEKKYADKIHESNERYSTQIAEQEHEMAGLDKNDVDQRNDYNAALSESIRLERARVETQRELEAKCNAEIEKLLAQHPDMRKFYHKDNIAR